METKTRKIEMILDDDGRVPAFVATFISTYFVWDVHFAGVDSQTHKLACSPLFAAYADKIMEDRNTNQAIFFGFDYYPDHTLNGLSWRFENNAG